VVADVPIGECGGRDTAAHLHFPNLPALQVVRNPFVCEELSDLP
jgi:hypothetical protein